MGLVKNFVKLDQLFVHNFKKLTFKSIQIQNQEYTIINLLSQ